MTFPMNLEFSATFFCSPVLLDIRDNEFGLISLAFLLALLVFSPLRSYDRRFTGVT
jgi:hypothetical protein